MRVENTCGVSFIHISRRVKYDEVPRSAIREGHCTIIKCQSVEGMNEGLRGIFSIGIDNIYYYNIGTCMNGHNLII